MGILNGNRYRTNLCGERKRRMGTQRYRNGQRGPTEKKTELWEADIYVRHWGCERKRVSILMGWHFARTGHKPANFIGLNEQSDKNPNFNLMSSCSSNGFLSSRREKFGNLASKGSINPLWQPRKFPHLPVLPCVPTPGPFFQVPDRIDKWL